MHRKLLFGVYLVQQNHLTQVQLATIMPENSRSDL